MATNRFHFDTTSKDNAKIKVIGVGGGGGNAIANMIAKGLDSVEYIALNTDSQALKQSPADHALQVGTKLTDGLGAGARPQVGREAVEENRHEIEEIIEGADMVFVTAGMGGGTGTGGAPVVASIAKKKGILTVGVVTTPFSFEGKPRMKNAMEGIQELKKNCDTLIVIPNERLMDLCDENTTMLQAFDMANEVLYNATRGISDLILIPGLVNVDFADVRTTMEDGGAAIMGSGSASGPDRAELATRMAINSPLLDGLSIQGATKVLMNVSAGLSLTMRDASIAASIVQQEAGENAEIIWGTVLDADFGDELRVTVIATGFDLGEKGVKPIEGTVRPSAAPFTRPADLPARATEAARPLPNPTYTRHRPQDFYKGEGNLKSLDEPAVFRKPIAVNPIRPIEPAPAEPKPDATETARRFATGTSGPVSNRDERIAKGNPDQPAFLRKVMD